MPIESGISCEGGECYLTNIAFNNLSIRRQNPAAEIRVAAEMPLSRRCWFCGRTLLYKESGKMFETIATPQAAKIQENGAWLREEAQVMMSEVRPTFSTELVLFLTDLAYQSLRRRLRRSAGMVETLDCMYMLLQYAVTSKGGKTTVFNNRYAAELVGRISRLVEFPMVFEEKE